MMIKIDENAPEYYVLDCVVTDEQADVGCAMELRKPQTVEQLAKKCGRSVEETGRLAHELADIGTAQGNIQMLDYVLSEFRVSGPGKYHQTVV